MPGRGSPVVRHFRPIRVRALMLQLPDREELQHPVLHVVQAVVVLVEDLLGAVEIDLVVGALAPRQLGDPLKVGADDLVLGGLGRGAVEAPQLALDFTPGRFAQLQLRDPLAQLVGLVAVALLAQLLANLLQLFPKQHLALPLAQLLLDLGLNVLLCVETDELPLDREQRGSHSILVVEGLEKGLLLGGGEVELEGDQIGEGTGVVDPLNQLVEVLGGRAAPRSQLGGPLPQLCVEGGDLRIVGVGEHLALQQLYGGPEHRLPVVGEGQRAGTRLPLDENLDPAPHTVGLNYPHDRASRVEHLGVGVVLVAVLRDGEEAPVSVQRFLHGLDRAGPASRNRHGHAGVHDRVAQRQHW